MMGMLLNSYYFRVYNSCISLLCHRPPPPAGPSMSVAAIPDHTLHCLSYRTSACFHLSIKIRTCVSSWTHLIKAERCSAHEQRWDEPHHAQWCRTKEKDAGNITYVSTYRRNLILTFFVSLFLLLPQINKHVWTRRTDRESFPEAGEYLRWCQARLEVQGWQD